MEPRRDAITGVLRELAAGEDAAADRLLEMVYAELRALARAQLGKAAHGQTVQATALVHDAYLRLFDREALDWENRRHFFFAAARAMRDLLVERARAKASDKRGGGRQRVDLEALTVAVDAPPDDLIALDDELERIGREDPKRRQLVELRFFAGMTMEEISKTLDVPLRTLEREWRLTRAKLARALADRDEPDAGGAG